MKALVFCFLVGVGWFLGVLIFPRDLWVQVGVYGFFAICLVLLGSFIKYCHIKSTNSNSGNDYVDDIEFPKINPASGLPMSGGSDTGGNLYGSSTDNFSVYGSFGSGSNHNSLFND